MKVEIKQNEWDNWVGYFNNRIIAHFVTTISDTQMEKARKWKELMTTRVEIYPNRVGGTGAKGKYALAIDGCFVDAYETKLSAVHAASNWVMNKIN